MLAASAVSMRTASLEQLLAATADDDPVSFVPQRDCQRQADTARGARDENGVAGDLHDSSLLAAGTFVTCIPIM
jgi:hypothetical protein